MRQVVVQSGGPLRVVLRSEDGSRKSKDQACGGQRQAKSQRSPWTIFLPPAGTSLQAGQDCRPICRTAPFPPFEESADTFFAEKSRPFPRRRLLSAHTSTDLCSTKSSVSSASALHLRPEKFLFFWLGWGTPEVDLDPGCVSLSLRHPN